MSFVQGFVIMADSIFMGYLIWAAWQDYKEKMVVRYTHLVGLAAVFLMACIKTTYILDCPMEYMLGIAFVFLTQIAAQKCRLYGMADIFVFSLIGLFFVFSKGPKLYMTAYLLVFALSGCLLVFVQIGRKNIKGTHLNCSVAYIPYICFAFFLTNVVV